VVVPLTRADLKALSKESDDEDSGEETLVDDSESPLIDLPDKTERIILRNTARHRAMQINAAIGKDIWKRINRLEIKDNVAEDQALQVNHGLSLEVALKLFDLHDKRTIAPCQQVGRKRHDSVLRP
jgi:hypothetical protein